MKTLRFPSAAGVEWLRFSTVIVGLVAAIITFCAVFADKLVAFDGSKPSSNKDSTPSINEDSNDTVGRKIILKKIDSHRGIALTILGLFASNSAEEISETAQIQEAAINEIL